jgi:ribosomal protein L12E/L44/L45/RPP1/RPP2
VALVLKIYADLKPQPLTEEQLLRQQRPMLVPVEDVKLDLREIGRKKAAEAAAAAAAGGAAAAQQTQQRQEQQQ